MSLAELVDNKPRMTFHEEKVLDIRVPSNETCIVFSTSAGDAFLYVTAYEGESDQDAFTEAMEVIKSNNGGDADFTKLAGKTINVRTNPETGRSYVCRRGVEHSNEACANLLSRMKG